jgi:hypothetical protein
VLHSVERHTFSSSAALAQPFARALRRRLVAAGLRTTDRVFGLRWSGQLRRERLAGLIRHLPPGSSEIYLHPATGAYAGSARGYSYREELEALTAPEVIAACRDSGLRLGGFAQLAPAEAVAT